MNPPLSRRARVPAFGLLLAAALIWRAATRETGAYLHAQAEALVPARATAMQAAPPAIRRTFFMATPPREDLLTR